jgi:hypothetical protein
METIAGRLGTAARAALVAAAGLAVVQAGPGITGLGPVRRAAFPRLAGRGAAGHLRVGPLAEHWAVPDGAARRADGGAAQ